MNGKAFLIGILTALLLYGCSEQTKISPQEMAYRWSDMALYVTQFTPANSPTYASRGVGYIGLTMYESIVHGFDSHTSLAGQLNDLSGVPRPEANAEYVWELSFNAASAEILRSIYNQTSDENKLKIDSLEEATLRMFRSGHASDIVERSRAYGRSVAQAIFEWSKTDGGHRGYLRNFDKDFEHPAQPGHWQPPLYAQAISHNPLHPYWGDNRTFLAINKGLELPYMIPYDTTEGSDYYNQFLAVYEKDLTLTRDEKEQAIWWGDDPDVTFTPPGHSFYLATSAMKLVEPDFIQIAETYARVGLAVADAFINCWKWKYHFFSERPNTFIPQFIDREWVSFWPDPPFPAFPSGHAIQASAMATVMIDLYGQDLVFADSAHYGRERDELRDTDFVVQDFDEFWDIATETADSRFYGGIHTPQDNDVGLEEGRRIATHVNQLIWRKE
ncbi:MAG: vanadium-dependent haloperoxidase [Bacteroidota bacterium]